MLCSALLSIHKMNTKWAHCAVASFVRCGCIMSCFAFSLFSLFLNARSKCYRNIILSSLSHACDFPICPHLEVRTKHSQLSDWYKDGALVEKNEGPESELIATSSVFCCVMLLFSSFWTRITVCLSACIPNKNRSRTVRYKKNGVYSWLCKSASKTSICKNVSIRRKMFMFRKMFVQKKDVVQLYFAKDFFGLSGAWIKPLEFSAALMATLVKMHIASYLFNQQTLWYWLTLSSICISLTHFCISSDANYTEIATFNNNGI